MQTLNAAGGFNPICYLPLTTPSGPQYPTQSWPRSFNAQRIQGVFAGERINGGADIGSGDRVRKGAIAERQSTEVRIPSGN